MSDPNRRIDSVVAWFTFDRLLTVLAFLAIALAAFLMPARTLRPQAISLLLVAVTVALLVRRRYAWLPPLFLVWANLHGAVLTGVLLVAAALVSEACAHLMTRWRPPLGGPEGRLKPADTGYEMGSRSKRVLGALSATLALCALATLAT